MKLIFCICLILLSFAGTLMGQTLHGLQEGTGRKRDVLQRDTLDPAVERLCRNSFHD